MTEKNEFHQIDDLKKLLDSYRPLPLDTVESLQKAFAVEMTYNSNAIEGNTLTLTETKVVVEDGITIGGKTVKEHLEALNHYEAIEYVESIVGTEEISEETIKNIHYLVMKGIDKEFAGKYRMANVVISGSGHIPPNYMQAPMDITSMLAWYNEAKDYLHPVELAALFHFKFVYIHPFRDGNGYTARLLMNLILMQYGYPPAVIQAADRLRYIEALEKASTIGETRDFVSIVAGAVNSSLEKFIKVVGSI